MGAAGLPVRRRPEIGGHPGQAIPVQILAGGIGRSSLGARSSEMGRGPAARRAGRPVPRAAVARPKLGRPTVRPRSLEKAPCVPPISAGFSAQQPGPGFLV
jgi:hypothetical protein